MFDRYFLHGNRDHPDYQRDSGLQARVFRQESIYEGGASVGPVCSGEALIVLWYVSKENG
jgi:hypothetical protein